MEGSCFTWKHAAHPQLGLGMRSFVSGVHEVQRVSHCPHRLEPPKSSVKDQGWSKNEITAVAKEGNNFGCKPKQRGEKKKELSACVTVLEAEFLLEWVDEQQVVLECPEKQGWVSPELAGVRHCLLVGERGRGGQRLRGTSFAHLLEVQSRNCHKGAGFTYFSYGKKRSLKKKKEKRKAWLLNVAVGTWRMHFHHRALGFANERELLYRLPDSFGFGVSPGF